MKIKKPSVKGMKNCGYLGHFAQDKYVQEGHNTSGTWSLTAPDPKFEKMRKEIESYRTNIRKNLEKGKDPWTGIKTDKPRSKMSPSEIEETRKQMQLYNSLIEEETRPLAVKSRK